MEELYTYNLEICDRINKSGIYKIFFIGSPNFYIGSAAALAVKE